jgi:hypothetical protein
MPEKAEPKISTAEAVLILLFVLLLDAIDLIPFAGDLTDVAGAPLLLYYMSKHINGVAYLIAEILDAIPVVQELPSRTIVWIATVLFDRFAPAAVEQAVEKVGELEQGGEGAGTGELEAGASEGAAGAEAGAGAAAATEEGAQGGQALNAGEGVEGEARIKGEETSSSSTSSQQEEARSGGGEEGGQGDQEGAEKTGSEEDEMAAESEGDPMKENAKKLLDEVDGGGGNESFGGGDETEDEEDTSEAPPPNVVGIDSSSKWQANQQQKERPATPSVYDIKRKEKKAA